MEFKNAELRQLVEQAKKDTEEDIKKRNEGLEEIIPDKPLPEGVTQINEKTFLMSPQKAKIESFHWTKQPMPKIDEKIHFPYKLVNSEDILNVVPEYMKSNIRLVPIKKTKRNAAYLEEFYEFMLQEKKKESISLVPTMEFIKNLLNEDDGLILLFYSNSLKVDEEETIMKEIEKNPEKRKEIYNSLSNDIINGRKEELVSVMLIKFRYLLTTFKSNDIGNEFEKLVNRKSEDITRKEKIKKYEEEIERTANIEIEAADSEEKVNEIKEKLESLKAMTRETDFVKEMEYFKNYYLYERINSVNKYIENYFSEENRQLKEVHKVADILYFSISPDYRKKVKGTQKFSKWFYEIIDKTNKYLSKEYKVEEGIFFTSKLIPRPISKSNAIIIKYLDIKKCLKCNLFPIEDMLPDAKKFKKPIEVLEKLHLPKCPKHENYEIFPLKDSPELLSLAMDFFVRETDNYDIKEIIQKERFTKMFPTTKNYGSFVLIYKGETPVVKALFNIFINRLFVNSEELKAAYVQNLLVTESDYSIIQVFDLCCALCKETYGCDVCYTRNMNTMAKTEKKSTRCGILPISENLCGYNFVAPYKDEHTIFFNPIF
jgi:hypothetical protein